MAQTGYTPISIYYSSTASNTPTAGNLVAGELAINTNDGKLYYKDSGGVVQTLASKATGSIGGTSTQVQYNSSGSLAGSANFVWDITNSRLGINTASPAYPLDVSGTIRGTGNIFAGDGSAFVFGTATTAYLSGSSSSNVLTFITSSAEKMRIDTSGNLLVGGTTVRDSTQITNEFSSKNGMAFYCVTNTSAVDFAVFRANAGTLCGAISRVGTTSAVVYTTTSDYRLKENVKPFVNALDSVSKLKPVTYTWIDDGASANGFIAHELQEVCPDAVIGIKDEIDDEGKPKYQAIDQSKIVALLTAAIQEQQVMIEELKAKVAALEATK
jgi:Chaperone of endosialidase